MTTKNKKQDKPLLRIFTSEDGKIQMLIPINWEYKNRAYANMELGPESFGAYENMLGAFQLSCKPVTEHISGLITANRLSIQSSDQESLDFTDRLFSADDMTTYIWMAAIDDHFIFVTYITSPENLKSAEGQSELQYVRESINTVKFIKPEHRDIVVAQNRFSLFMASIAATIDLRNRAIENESHMEYILLCANHIDGLLRCALILTNQIENRNEQIDISILFQAPSDKPIMEKEIYKRALDRGIIDQSLFDQLFTLYNERNKVVHRYIITDLRTEDIVRIAANYSAVDQQIDDIVNVLEKKQHDLKVGMYGKGERPGSKLKGETLELLKYQIRDKHGKVELNGTGLFKDKI